MQPPILRRVDLHVHTVFSNFRHLKILRARDSYNDPMRVYERCREEGCDYVAITDHDTIDGALDLLARRPDLEPTVIVGEEVESAFPDGGPWLHLNVLGVTESIHDDISRLKGNVRELVAYLRSNDLLHFLNHPLQSYRVQRAPVRFVEEMLDLFTHLEVGNGTLSVRQNRAIADILDWARRRGLTRTGVGGSDAHGLRPIGAYTTLAPGETKAAWLESVAGGRCLVEGREIGLLGLVGETYAIVARYYRSLATSEGRRGMTATNLAAAAGFVPICLAGVPFLLNVANHVSITAVSELVHRSLAREGAPSPAERPPDLATDPEG